MTEYLVTVTLAVKAPDAGEASEQVWQGLSTVIDYYNAEHPYAKYRGVPIDYSCVEVKRDG